MNKNNRDCNVHELGDRLKCQRESHVKGESNERIQYTYFNQAMRENHSKRQFERVEQQDTGIGTGGATGARAPLLYSDRGQGPPYY